MALIFLLGSLNFSTQLASAASSAGNFEVTYTISNSWGTGANVNITIKNKGAAVNGWTLGFKFPGNQKISSAWNCKYTQSGQAVQIKDAGYNAELAAGSSVSFGLNIEFTGDNKVPTEFIVNSQNTSSTPAEPTEPSKPTQPEVNVPDETVKINDGWYYIKNVNAQKYLQAAGNNAGANVEISTGTGLAVQKWYVKNLSNGYITLTSAVGDFMVDVAMGENKDGANIGIYNAYSGDAQQYVLKKSSTQGAYIIATKVSDGSKVLDVYKQGKEDGTNVCQWTYGGRGNQQWIFEAVTSTPNKPSEPTKPSKAKFHCFLLLGQSNMAGFPKAQAADKVKDDRILVLGYDNNPSNGRRANEWAVASAPLHEAWNDAVGPGDWFAKTLINKLPEGDTIGLIPCAISGEKIETFMKGGSKYNWIIERAKLAQAKGGVIDGIIFHQGESNCGDPNWPNKVNKLITDLRNDLKLGDVPFIAGELLRTGGCSSHNRLVNQIPSVVKNSYVVSSEGLAGDPTDTWNLHFGHDAQVTLGKRYAAKMSEVLGW